MNQQFLTELKAVTAENRIFTDEPMKKHTTFRVGGPVSYTHLTLPTIPCGRPGRYFSAAKGNRACGGHPSVQEV